MPRATSAPPASSSLFGPPEDFGQRPDDDDSTPFRRSDPGDQDGYGDLNRRLSADPTSVLQPDLGSRFGPGTRSDADDQFASTERSSTGNGDDRARGYDRPGGYDRARGYDRSSGNDRAGNDRAGNDRDAAADPDAPGIADAEVEPVDDALASWVEDLKPAGGSGADRGEDLRDR